MKKEVGMKNRRRQRENRRRKHTEELLFKESGYGYKDLTSYNAIRWIASKGKAEIAQR